MLDVVDAIDLETGRVEEAALVDLDDLETGTDEDAALVDDKALTDEDAAWVAEDAFEETTSTTELEATATEALAEEDLVKVRQEI